MGNRDIRKEAKKKKKSDSMAAVSSMKPMISQPELVKKSKKNA